MLSTEASVEPEVEGVSDERQIRVYVTSWCGACRAALRFFEEHEIAYESVDIDADAAAAEIVMGLNRGNRSVSTILIDGEHALTEPSRQELCVAFGVDG